ncbi:hypothetical protein [Endozoicomonas elysicola]|uniref:Lipocalin-like domain-containing protein n=1 Tax=Endozoicomonas elysicola TaxID=305900 RepID=A0A081KB96_9GAMM|nr:hypothetical protein [Endozoicomonas elysicola]KEI71422.1 hypothetical protein GV64_12330 [Endozoicomonas elysicola]
MGKALKVSSLFLVFFLSGCATDSYSSASAEPNFDSSVKSKLYGSWNCEAAFNDSGAKMTSEFTETYVRNGTLNSIGSMNIQFSPELPEIFYTITSHGTWSLDDGYLITNYAKTKIKNITHPEFDEIININDLFPESVSESSKIVSLSNTTLSLQSESSGEYITCNREI